MVSLGTSQIMSVLCVVAGVGVVVAYADQADVRQPLRTVGTPAADATLQRIRPVGPVRTTPAGVVKTVDKSDTRATPQAQERVAAPQRQPTDSRTEGTENTLEMRRLRAIQEKAAEEGKRVFSRANPLMRSNPSLFDGPVSPKSKAPADQSHVDQPVSDKLSRISREEGNTIEPVVRPLPAPGPQSTQLTTGSVTPQRAAAVAPVQSTTETAPKTKLTPAQTKSNPKARQRLKRGASSTRSRRRYRRSRRSNKPRRYRYDFTAPRPKVWDLP
jgi:hypothetical protein